MIPGLLRSKIAPAAVAAVLAVLAADVARAVPVTLLDEDFNDVRVANAAATPNVLSGNPAAATLAGLPAGTLAGTTGNRNNLNVRRGDNPINTAGANGFDGAFGTDASNRFLVLGDNAGLLDGNPTSKEMYIRLPFVVPTSAMWLNVAYDFAFAGVDTSAPVTDRFSVSVLDSAFTKLWAVQTLLSPSGFSAGHLSARTNVQGDAAYKGQTLFLEFRLDENGAGTNTGAGVDNIVVTSAPEPTSMLLLASGLLGLAGVLRRRRP